MTHYTRHPYVDLLDDGIETTVLMGFAGARRRHFAANVIRQRGSGDRLLATGQNTTVPSQRGDGIFTEFALPAAAAVITAPP